MERPSRSTIFREKMKANKEKIQANTDKSEKKLPAHKRVLSEKKGEAR